jgi:hypothetical protein
MDLTAALTTVAHLLAPARPLLGAAAVTASCAAGVPQAVRSLRTRDVEGLPVVGTALGVAIPLWWLVWGLGVGDLSAVVTNVVVVVTNAAIAAAVVRGGPGRGRTAVSVVLAALAALPLVWAAGPGWVVAVATVVGLGRLAPQVALVAGGAVGGVSRRAAALALAAAVAWVAYWTAGAAWALTLPPLGAVVLSGAIVAGLVRADRRAARSSADLAPVSARFELAA